jgi:protein-S-isoprenylcysteine O-methyltransferase Ste14
MNLIQTIIFSCWIILGLYWLISAFFQKKIVEKSSYTNTLFQLIVMIVSAILLVKYDFYSPLSYSPLAVVLVKQSLIIDFISIFLCILGLIIAIWARKVLSDNWSIKVVFKKNHELIQIGPYEYIRHPIYTGLLLMFVGTALIVGRISGFVGFIILFIGLYIKLKQEEKLMIKHFNKKYLDYKTRTKALVPYVL